MERDKEIQRQMMLQDMRVVAEEVYNKLGTRYGVGEIPVHVHNGQDTTPIPFSNIVNTQGWRSIARVVLTPTQVKGLNSTPVTLVAPSPIGGSNFVIIEGITAFLDYGGTAFTGANNLEFRYTDGSGTKVTADISSTWLNGTVDDYQHVAGIVTAFTPVKNASVVVSVPVANPATGNSTVTFVVAYRIVSFSP